MQKVTSVAVGLLSLVALVTACNKDEPPPVAPIPSPYPPQPVAPGYGPANGPTPGQETPGVAPAEGQLATPGPTALACQNDSQCITHRCNLQYGRCAFPCVSDNDCIQGTTCLTAAGPAAACVPKAPGAP